MKKKLQKIIENLFELDFCPAQIDKINFYTVTPWEEMKFSSREWQYSRGGDFSTNSALVELVEEKSRRWWTSEKIYKVKFKRWDFVISLTKENIRTLDVFVC